MRTAILIAVSLCLGLERAPAQSANTAQKSIEFLRKLMQSDGGYRPFAEPNESAGSSLRATAAAVRALRYFGKGPQSATSTARWVERCYDKTTGGFGDVPGQRPTAATTAVGIMAAVDLNVPPQLYSEGATRYLSEQSKSLEDIRLAAAAFEAMKTGAPKAEEWLRQIAATRNADGTFGNGRDAARATGGTAVLILRLGGRIENRDAVLKAMRSGQRSDGGFGSAARAGSDLESTYRIMRAFAMMNERPAAPDKLREFIATCRHPSGGYGVSPGEPPSAGGTYFASAVLHWLDEW